MEEIPLLPLLYGSTYAVSLYRGWPAAVRCRWPLLFPFLPPNSLLSAPTSSVRRSEKPKRTKGFISPLLRCNHRKNKGCIFQHLLLTAITFCFSLQLCKQQALENITNSKEYDVILYWQYHFVVHKNKQQHGPWRHVLWNLFYFPKIGKQIGIRV